MLGLGAGTNQTQNLIAGGASDVWSAVACSACPNFFGFLLASSPAALLYFLRELLSRTGQVSVRDYNSLKKQRSAPANTGTRKAPRAGMFRSSSAVF